MKLVSRASRPALTVGFLRIYTEGEEQTRRVGCQDEPDSLSHYNECPRLYNMFTSFWVQSTASTEKPSSP